MSRAHRDQVGAGVAVLAVLLGAALTLTSSLAAAQRLARPWSCATCISNYYYYDHDDGSGVDDWRCGTSTYNGHPASDFSLSGGIAAIDTGYAVRAAADGEVIHAVDGNPDRCRITGLADCASGTSCTYDTANFVAIRHSGRTTRYVHLRRGSVRVAVGDHVTCGQIIGEIGSSGCSTNAHLHFEVRPLSDSRAGAYDPYLGACSPRTTSAWVMQGSYRGYPGACAEPPPVDASVATPDAGAAPDAGLPTEPDAGADPDAGALPDGALRDAGSSTDAALSRPDAAARGMDAAARAVDAGRGTATLMGGCSCRVGVDRTASRSLTLLLACTGAWWARRRVRRRPWCDRSPPGLAASCGPRRSSPRPCPR